MSDAIGLTDSVFVVLNPDIEAFRSDITGIGIFGSVEGVGNVVESVSGPALHMEVTGPAIPELITGISN